MTDYSLPPIVPVVNSLQYLLGLSIGANVFGTLVAVARAGLLIGIQRVGEQLRQAHRSQDRFDRIMRAHACNSRALGCSLCTRGCNSSASRCNWGVIPCSWCARTRLLRHVQENRVASPVEAEQVGATPDRDVDGGHQAHALIRGNIQRKVLAFGD
jgi:hypothetical protein